VPSPPLYPENLREIAADAYALSARLCGACRDQHALWSYLRLSRASTGAESPDSKLQARLTALFDGGRRNVLIAGAQDTGLLTLMARAGAGHSLNIVVLDLCDTPLELCRTLASQWSLPTETIKQDLFDLQFERRFDVVLMHGTLNFIAAERQPQVLARLRQAMRPGGRLVLMFNTSRAIDTEAAAENHFDYVDFVLSELKRVGVPLPDSEQIMRDRFNARAHQRELRDKSFADPREVEGLLDRAAFKVESCDRIGVELAAPVDTLLAKFSKQRFMLVAEPKLST
jgi:SAM-dependent methyltransferase